MLYVHVYGSLILCTCTCTWIRCLCFCHKRPKSLLCVHSSPQEDFTAGSLEETHRGKHQETSVVSQVSWNTRLYTYNMCVYVYTHHIHALYCNANTCTHRSYPVLTQSPSQEGKSLCLSAVLTHVVPYLCTALSLVSPSCQHTRRVKVESSPRYADRPGRSVWGEGCG